MDYLVFWVLAGRGWVVADGVRHDAVAGELFCLMKGRPHEYASDAIDPWEVVWVHFDGRLAPAFIEAIQHFGDTRIALGHDPFLRGRWLELIVNHAACGPHFQTVANTGLYALLGLTIHQLQVRQSARSSTDTPFDVHHLQAWIQHHLAEPISVADLARQANLSPSHFTRQFRKLFKASPTQYVMQIRVAQARELLTQTPMPLKQIAAAVGCHDRYYFSRMFKKITGQSPAAYRSEALVRR